MKSLGFLIERIPYHPSSGMTGEMVRKRRDDGRVGPAVGDEALLWDELQAVSMCFDEIAAGFKAQEKELEEARKEIAELRRQLESKRAKR